MQNLVQIALVVHDYDEAIAFYLNKLRFSLIEDTVLNPEKRWVVIAPPGSKQTTVLLAKAANAEQRSIVGKQTGGRVFLFLHTDDFDNDHNRLIQNQVKIVRGPMQEPYGRVLVFEDLYGNLWDLIEPSSTKIL